MAKLTKRARVIRDKVEATKEYEINEAVALLKELATAKFAESVDVAVNLGIDAKKSDQNVRGATVLPNGTGKDVRVAVFTQGANAEAAKEAGADIVGMDDLAEQVKKGEMNFDVVVASPDAMRVVGQLGQILGPRGLMPNPKTGRRLSRRDRLISLQTLVEKPFRAFAARYVPAIPIALVGAVTCRRAFFNPLGVVTHARYFVGASRGR